MATLLSILQDAAAELSLTPPSSVVGSTRPEPVQMLALLNREGQALLEVDWPQLVTLKVVTTVNGQADYAFPTDFHRIIDGTAWDRANGWPMLGPETPLEDRSRRESISGMSGIRRTYRNVGASLRIYPTPSVAGEELVYEYVSRNWCQATGGGATKPAMTADTDEPLIDEQLLILGVVWRFLAAKGMDPTIAFQNYQVRLDARKAALLGGGGVLNMEGGGGRLFADLHNLPDTGFAQ